MKRTLDLHAILLQSLVVHLVASLGRQNNENCHATSTSEGQNSADSLLEIYPTKISLMHTRLLNAHGS